MFSAKFLGRRNRRQWGLVVGLICRKFIVDFNGKKGNQCEPLWLNKHHYIKNLLVGVCSEQGEKFRSEKEMLTLGLNVWEHVPRSLKLHRTLIGILHQGENLCKGKNAVSEHWQHPVQNRECDVCLRSWRGGETFEIPFSSNLTAGFENKVVKEGLWHLAFNCILATSPRM